MAFVKSGSPVVDEVRGYIEGVAKNLADRIWGAKGPAWGTKLTEVEDLVVQIREVLSEKMLQQALERQAAQVAERPADYQACPKCGKPTTSRDPEPRLVHTRGGDAEWQEPQEHCSRCRRAFFPSIEEFGD
jgi:NADH pyrophosphatase NudC (nudix superfamily)